MPTRRLEREDLIAGLRELVERLKLSGDSASIRIDWLNDNATIFIPTLGKVPEWQPIYDDSHVSVWVLSAEALLAMKLMANRPGRDEDDIAALMTICGLATIDDADTLIDEYFPGDALSDRGLRMLTGILRQGLPERSPEPAEFRIG
ncbi:hypothetical protein [Subtercola lobariae]|uniref:Uncharacterized protein n=1 Tax=Subtercola lobariae TaxID=1588641 RepID=A0A917EZC3_9MICO|nr:hypothetical protein [Subtercola lobariae]GGF34763.1 hypothetical protein GCM10011399_29870 [Subtercola lobariae]